MVLSGFSVLKNRPGTKHRYVGERMERGSPPKQRMMMMASNETPLKLGFFSMSVAVVLKSFVCLLTPDLQEQKAVSGFAV